MRMNTPASGFAETAFLLVKFTIYYFLLSLASVMLTRWSGDIVTLWFPNALGVAYLILAPKKHILPLLVCAGIAMVAAHLVVQYALTGLAIIPVHLIEMALAAYLVRLTGSAERFSDAPENLLRFLLVAIFVPCLISATLAALLFQGSESFSRLWWTWFAGMVIASLGLLPVAMMVLRLGWRDFLQCIKLKQSILWIVSIIFLSAFSITILPYPFIYILVPLTIAAVTVSFETMTALVFLSTLATGITLAIGHLATMHLTSGSAWQIYLPFALTIIPPLIVAAGMRQSRIREDGRREAELALEQSNQDLRTIIDHTPAMIGYWGRDLKNRFANRAYADWFGITHEQIHNHHIRDVIGEERYASNAPFIEAVLRGESPVYERAITNQHGETHHVLASYVPDIVNGETQGFYAFINDITTLTLAQREQTVAQAQLQSVIDAASEFSIIATALDGTIKVFSAGAERMLGYRSGEIVNKTSPLLFHLTEEMDARQRALELELGIPIRNHFEVFTAKIRDGHADVFEWTYRRKDGSCLPVRLIATAMHDENGNVNGFLGIAKDISQQRQLQSSLVKAKEQAESASRAKSEFVANMSHEIRTPLNAVLGMAHLLGATTLSNDQRDYLEMIRVSGNSLLGIINDILDFSKIEAGRMDVASESFTLNDVLGAVANIMMVNSGEKELELALGVAPDVPQHLIGDAQHLQQVLVNLVSNAIKFTERGEVSLLVECEAVPSDNAVILRFLVRDTGIGMTPGEQEKLFSAFSQADTSTTRRFGGTGLGLAICKRLVALMGGTILLRSEFGLGSEFNVTITLQVGAAVPPLPEVGSAKKMRVLVIDDNVTSREYLCQTIRSLHWDVHSASTGADGVALAISNLHEPFDLILIDWQMPDMDSFIIMQTIRAAVAPVKPDMHIAIMVSAFGRGKLIGDRNAVLADTILVKPVTGENLLAMTQRGSVITRKEGDRSGPFELLHRKWDHRIDGAHILLVEDNHLNQVVARGMLMQAGASVDVADNGMKAIECMVAPNNYDIILMDVQMPVMDGCTAAKKIREELMMTIPILAMTAGVLLSEQELCRASGMNDFIPKPIDLEQMFSAILRYLPVREPRAVTPNLPVKVAAKAGGESSQIFNPEPVMQVGKSDDVYRKKMLDLIKSAVDQSPLQFSEARQAWEGGKTSEAAKILHSMRSALGMLGARQFSAATVAIEKALHDEEFDEASLLFDFAASSLKITIQEASLWLEANTEQGTES